MSLYPRNYRSKYPLDGYCRKENGDLLESRWVWDGSITPRISRKLEREEYPNRPEPNILLFRRPLGTDGTDRKGGSRAGRPSAEAVFKAIWVGMSVHRVSSLFVWNPLFFRFFTTGSFLKEYEIAWHPLTNSSFGTIIHSNGRTGYRRWFRDCRKCELCVIIGNVSVQSAADHPRPSRPYPWARSYGRRLPSIAKRIRSFEERYRDQPNRTKDPTK